MNAQARFKAQAQNQFAQSRFQAANTMDTFNKGAQNQFSMADTQSENQYNLAEYGAGNQMEQFNTTAANNALKFGAQSRLSPMLTDCLEQVIWICKVDNTNSKLI